MSSIFIYIIVVYAILFYCSYKVRYFSKILIPQLVLTIAGLLTIPTCLLLPKNEINLRIFCVYTYYISKYFTDVSFELRGNKNLQQETAAIVVANHQSCIDGLGCSYYWYLAHPMSMVSKRTMLYFGPLGLALYLGGLVHVDRANTRQAKDILDKDIESRIKRKAKLLVFPEGTRNYSGDSLLEFKKGAFYLAIKHQIPIIPLVYSSQKSYYDVEKHFWYSKKLILEALPSVSTKGLTSDNVSDLVNSVREKMLVVFKKNSGLA